MFYDSFQHLNTGFILWEIDILVFFIYIHFRQCYMYDSGLLVRLSGVNFQSTVILYFSLYL